MEPQWTLSNSDFLVIGVCNLYVRPRGMWSCLVLTAWQYGRKMATETPLLASDNDFGDVMMEVHVFSACLVAVAGVWYRAHPEPHG